MPTLTLSRGGAPPPPTRFQRATFDAARGSHAKCVLIGLDTGRRVTLPFGPTGGERAGIARAFEQRERTGRKPTNTPTGDQLRTMSWQFLLAHPDNQIPVVPWVIDLRNLVRFGERIAVSYGAADSGPGVWRPTDYSESVLRRKHGNNDDTQTMIALVLTEAVDAFVQIGPLSGGAVLPPAVPVPEGSAPRTHTVAAGDTLSAIAFRYYGRPDWQGIARANNIVNPDLIRAGQTLTIPPA